MPARLIVPNTAKRIDYHGAFRRVRVQVYAESSVYSVQSINPMGLNRVHRARAWQPIDRGPHEQMESAAIRLASVMDAACVACGMRPPARIKASDE
jgi:hypothetical protein